MKAAQKLLGALTFGGGSVWAGGGVEEANKPMLAQIHENGTENGQFPTLISNFVIKFKR